MNATGWRSGAASAIITPTEPMWLAGWAARREPAAGKAMDLRVKAVAFEDPEGGRLVIVTADLIAIPGPLAAAVAARISDRWRIPRERLLFNASHTHTAPEVRPDKVFFFEIPAEFAARIPPYVARLEEKMTGVIEAALERLQPATLRVTQVSAGFAHNRRSPSGAVDHDVPVMVVLDAHEKPLAILFGYACHNLILAPTFCEFHGDYAGMAQSILERRFPGAVAMFLAGAGADQDPSPRGTLELARQHGETLAQNVEQGLTRSGRAIAGALRTAFEAVTLDLLPLPAPEQLEADVRSDDRPRRRKAEYLLNALGEHRVLPTTHPCPVQVLQFGRELLLIALGGEPVVEFALRFKRDFAGPLVWVAGYSNDMFGYLPTVEVQRAGGYEGGRASLWSALPMPVAETAEDRINEAVHRLVRNVRAATTHPHVDRLD